MKYKVLRDVAEHRMESELNRYAKEGYEIYEILRREGSSYVTIVMQLREGLDWSKAMNELRQIQ